MAKRGRKSNTQAQIEYRRDQVQRLYFMYAKPYQIAEALGVSLSTIYRDIEELETSIACEVAKYQIRNVKFAMMAYQNAERQLWKLFTQDPPTRPVQIGKKTVMQPVDDRFVRVAIMDRIIQLMKCENALVGLDDVKNVMPLYEKKTEISDEEYEKIEKSILEEAERLEKQYGEKPPSETEDSKKTKRTSNPISERSKKNNYR